MVLFFTNYVRCPWCPWCFDGASTAASIVRSHIRWNEAGWASAAFPGCVTKGAGLLVMGSTLSRGSREAKLESDNPSAVWCALYWYYIDSEWTCDQNSSLLIASRHPTSVRVAAAIVVAPALLSQVHEYVVVQHDRLPAWGDWHLLLFIFLARLRRTQQPIGHFPWRPQWPLVFTLEQELRQSSAPSEMGSRLAHLHVYLTLHHQLLFSPALMLQEKMSFCCV